MLLLRADDACAQPAAPPPAAPTANPPTPAHKAPLSMPRRDTPDGAACTTSSGVSCGDGWRSSASDISACRCHLLRDRREAVVQGLNHSRQLGRIGCPQLRSPHLEPTGGGRIAVAIERGQHRLELLIDLRDEGGIDLLKTGPQRCVSLLRPFD